MINLIGISGYAGVGKDLTAKIIQYLIAKSNAKDPKTISAYEKQGISSNVDYTYTSGWEIRKFAGKLKQIASIMTGIPIEKFENQEFKKTYLPKEWATLELDEIIGAEVDDEEDAYYERKMSVREFLQKLGTDAIRNHLHENAWVNATFADYKTVYTTVSDKGKFEIEDPEIKPKWIITDTRFPNEAQAVKDRGGIVIRVNRPDSWSHSPAYTVDNGNAYEQAKETKHSSETSLDSWNFDWVISNNGSIDDLTTKVELMLKHFGILTE